MTLLAQDVVYSEGCAIALLIAYSSPCQGSHNMYRSDVTIHNCTHTGWTLYDINEIGQAQGVLRISIQARVSGCIVLAFKSRTIRVECVGGFKILYPSNGNQRQLCEQSQHQANTKQNDNKEQSGKA